MNGYNFEAIGTAVIASFVASAVYYSLFLQKARQLSLTPNPETKHRPKPKMLIAEIVRNVLLATILAYVINQMHLTTALDALWVSLLLWVAFPAMLLVGSVMYEKFPLKLAIVHMGDWALKLPIMTVVITLWR